MRIVARNDHAAVEIDDERVYLIDGTRRVELPIRVSMVKVDGDPRDGRGYVVEMVAYMIREPQ